MQTAHDIATCMYYTGIDPFTKQEVYVARHLKDRKLQRALMQFFKPENHFEVRKALEQAATRTSAASTGPAAAAPAGRHLQWEWRDGMPRFESVMSFSRPVAEVFDFFLRPANQARLSPPELHLLLVEGPERLQLGSSLTWKGRRWGVPQRVVSKVTALEPDALLVVEQQEGPFARWAHAQRFEATPAGTRVTDQIDYEPPGGLLGLTVTADRVGRDLEWLFAYRVQQLRGLLGD
jgi:ligand-binding SRPBCC domain-containing protein